VSQTNYWRSERQQVINNFHYSGRQPDICLEEEAQNCGRYAILEQLAE